VWSHGALSGLFVRPSVRAAGAMVRLYHASRKNQGTQIGFKLLHTTAKIRFVQIYCSQVYGNYAKMLRW